MVNPEPFELPKEQLLARLKWYEDKYGSSIGNKRGLHNWKNLFKKPTLQDWIILFMLVMMLFVAWSYSHDISACREYIAEQEKYFIPTNLGEVNSPLANLTFTIKEDNENSNGT